MIGDVDADHGVLRMWGIETRTWSWSWESLGADLSSQLGKDDITDVDLDLAQPPRHFMRVDFVKGTANSCAADIIFCAIAVLDSGLSCWSLLAIMSFAMQQLGTRGI